MSLSVVPPLSSNTITLFQFSPFSYVFTSTQNISISTSSPEVLPLCSTSPDGKSITFASAFGFASSFANPLSLVFKTGSITIANYIVNVLPGRWTILPEPPFTFFRGEIITPIPFTNEVGIETAFIQPALPPGLLFTKQTPFQWLLQGTPVLQSPATSYLVVGRTTTNRLISTSISITISAERLVITGNVTTFSGMQIGTSIPSSVFTTSVPITSTSPFRYFTSSSLPDGLFYADKDGNAVVFPFTPSDPSNTIVVAGIPTLQTALDFQARAFPLRTFTSNVTLTANTGNLSQEKVLSFSFGPVVLFTEIANTPPIFAGIPLTSQPRYRAARYFQDIGVPITSITGTNLPSNLTLTFESDSSGAFLGGTAMQTGSGVYPFLATDASGFQQTTNVFLTVQSNQISIRPSVTDISFSFIQSRPLTQAKDGYYPANISFQATSSAGCNILYSITGFEDSGITISSNGVLTGVPTSSFPTRSIVVTATDTFASNTYNFSANIVPDQYTFSELSDVSFIQNRETQPFQISATTLSERRVVNISSSNLPTGLILDRNGRVTGIPTTNGTGSFTITGTTGFTTGSSNISYTIQPDSVLLLPPTNFISLTAGESIPTLDIEGISYSGRRVGNYRITGQTYGPTIQSETGILSGTMSLGYPPDIMYASSNTFVIQANAGDVSSSLPVRVDTLNPYINASLVALQSCDIPPSSNLFSSVTSTLFLNYGANQWSNLSTFFDRPFLYDPSYTYTTPFDHSTFLVSREYTSNLASPFSNIMPFSGDLSDSAYDQYIVSYASNVDMSIRENIGQTIGYVMNVSDISPQTAGRVYNSLVYPMLNRQTLESFKHYGISSTDVFDFVDSIRLSAYMGDSLDIPPLPPNWSSFVDFCITNFYFLTRNEILNASEDQRNLIIPIYPTEYQYMINYPSFIVAFVNLVQTTRTYFSKSTLFEYTLGPNYTTKLKNDALHSIFRDSNGTLFGVEGDVFLFAVKEDTIAYKTTFQGRIVKSIDDGNTWTTQGNIPSSFYPRTQPDFTHSSSSVANTSLLRNHPHKELSMAFTKSGNVMMLGGMTKPIPTSFDGREIPSIPLYRSTDEGVTWSVVNGSPLEVSFLNTDVSGMWIMSGSSLYRTSSNDPTLPVTEGDAFTLYSSSNQGETWSVVNGGFDRIGYHIAYGNGMWLATGISGPIRNYEVRYSTDGMNWSNIPEMTFQDANSNSSLYISTIADSGLLTIPMRIGPVIFTGSNWQVYTQPYYDVGDSIFVRKTKMFVHDLSSDILTNWNAVDLSGIAPDIPLATSTTPNIEYNFTMVTPSNVIGTGIPANKPSYTFLSSLGGPIFSNPSTETLQLYQYIPIDPIEISASGSGIVYYFIQDDALPPGFTFDPLTAKIQGRPITLGTYRIPIYAKDDVGTSQRILTLNIQIPRILKQQTSAGAFTSLVRHYTRVNAAQNSRDTRVLNTEEKGLGEFMAPSPPDVVSDVPCKVCVPK